MPKAQLITMEELSPDIRAMAEAMRSEQSFSYWITNYGVVEVRDVGVQKFKDVMWDFQRKFVRLLEEVDRLVVVKARQIGISTIMMHYAYWKIRFGPPNSQVVLVLSKSKDDASKALMGKLPLIHAAQPENMRMDIASQNSYFFQLSNGNAIVVQAATENAARGYAATTVILDEHAFHQTPETTWSSLQPTLEGAGKFFVVSTGNGVGNLFHDLYQKAKEGRNGFTPVFINWSAPAHRNEEWLERQRGDSVVDAMLFKQEYPATDDEAFAKTGSSPFDVAYVVEQIHKASLVKPLISTNEGRTRIWAEPMSGHQYAAGLDIAQGITMKGIADSTSLKIINMYNQQVAAWDGQMELNDAAPELVTLLNTYNAYLAIERNGPGAGMIAALQARGFNRFYRWEESHLYPDAPVSKNPTIGIQRTQAVKARQVEMLSAYINTGSLQSSDEIFWRQAATYIQKAPLRWGPQGQNKDDSVDAMTHALWAKEHMPRVHRPKQKRVIWR